MLPSQSRRAYRHYVFDAFEYRLSLKEREVLEINTTRDHREIQDPSACDGRPGPIVGDNRCI